MKRCLVLDLNRCTGCDTCVVACKLENGIELGSYWNRVLTVGPMGTHPDIEMYWLPMQCQQCENPSCVHVCPTGASYRDEKTGVVLVDHDKCIGCQYCMMACPYGVRVMNDRTNTVEKCTLCSHLTADGSDDPACVHSCSAAARIFGDLDDPESDVSKYVAAELEKDPDCVHYLPDPGNAHPASIYILSKKVANWKELK